MLPLMNVPPELKEKMADLTQKCVTECLLVMDHNLEGHTVLVAISVYYDVMTRLLLGMADELSRTMNLSPDKTAEMIIEFVTKGINLCREDVKMSLRANTTEEGRA